METKLIGDYKDNENMWNLSANNIYTHFRWDQFNGELIVWFDFD